MKKSDNNTQTKFKVGDTVRLDPKCSVGGFYFNDDGIQGDTLTTRMRNNMRGKEAVVTEVLTHRGRCYGYKLNIDNMHTYYDQMLKKVEDTLAKRPYVFNGEIEALLTPIEREGYRKLVDKALDEKMNETNPEAFDKLVETYKQYC